jgi:hypothetical protein
MSTLEIRTATMPKPRRAFAGFARIVSIIATVLDVFTEARDQAKAAHQRFPFADW